MYIYFSLVLLFHALQSNYIENNTWGKRKYRIFFYQSLTGYLSSEHSDFPHAEK